MFHLYQCFDKRWKWKHDGILSLSLSPQPFHGLGERSSPPIHGEQFQANRNAMIEDKWCNGEHNNGPCSGCASPRPRNNEDRQRELNHNEDHLNYEILPRDIFPLGPTKETIDLRPSSPLSLLDKNFSNTRNFF